VRKGFTLIELLLSLFLTMLIVYFSYNFLAEAKTKSEWGDDVDARFFRKYHRAKLLKDDIFYSEQNQILGSKNYSILKLKTKNSIHGIAAPYVVWLVLKESNELIRLESKSEISLPISEANIYNIFMDEMGKNCDIFKVYPSSGQTDLMVFYQFVDEKPVMFEVPIKLN
jgi:hypothetical protein